MKITKKEVKTIYDIEIQFKDFSEIYAKAKDDVMCEVMQAFTKSDLSNTTMGNLKHEFEILDDVKTIQYIVRKLGFDSIENYGYFKKKPEGFGVYRMVVSNYGDDIN